MSLNQPYFVDAEHPDRFEELYYETTYWHTLDNGIVWRRYKHWGDGYLAAQGCVHRYGDGSGCIKSFGGLDYVSVPVAMEARHYKLGELLISAVFSPPNGLGAMNCYFWEIYPLWSHDPSVDIERFSGSNGEREMEDRVRELFLSFVEEDRMLLSAEPD